MESCCDIRSCARRAFLDMSKNIDIYNLYRPVCNIDDYNNNVQHPAIQGTVPQLPFNFGKKSHRKTAGSKDDNPCVDYVTPYMNRPDAQKALHANVTKLPYPWQACGYHIQRWNVLPVIKRLIAGGGLRVLIYSGDADGMVPVTSTRYASRKLGLNITQDWTPWYGSNKQVGGWTTIYDGGLTFGTVRGAAHQVPASAPKRTLQIVGHFLADKKLPSVPF
ncbi:serine carboxypeptidase-like 34 isoform X3 [Tripterygium wilfordii]|uniref:serine carboxypeptidase-like 34 isoform X3 n=1 Tax=Tripterygium wilfordii TaxID=458696 RepID=UPI0018F81317|nr:serine carboxypeptidase-like 34 isoform X3 [Tripterygium wilfordii]